MANYEAQEKYQKKVGWVSKSYKLKKDLADEFAEACKARDESQAAVLSQLMRAYIEQK